MVGVLNERAGLGHAISIDDFGTGYSSLAQLQVLPLDQLKIDRCFVSAATEPDGSQLLRMIVDLAAHLHLQTVAEGIEKREHEQLALHHGCDLGQGYLYSRPMPAEELTTLFELRPGLTRMRVSFLVDDPHNGGDGPQAPS